MGRNQSFLLSCKAKWGFWITLSLPLIIWLHVWFANYASFLNVRFVRQILMVQLKKINQEMFIFWHCWQYQSNRLHAKLSDVWCFTCVYYKVEGRYCSALLCSCQLLLLLLVPWLGHCSKLHYCCVQCLPIIHDLSITNIYSPVVVQLL